MMEEKIENEEKGEVKVNRERQHKHEGKSRGKKKIIKRRNFVMNKKERQRRRG